MQPSIILTKTFSCKLYNITGFNDFHYFSNQINLNDETNAANVRFIYTDLQNCFYITINDKYISYTDNTITLVTDYKDASIIKLILSNINNDLQYIYDNGILFGLVIYPNIEPAKFLSLNLLKDGISNNLNFVISDYFTYKYLRWKIV